MVEDRAGRATARTAWGGWRGVVLVKGIRKRQEERLRGEFRSTGPIHASPQHPNPAQESKSLNPRRSALNPSHYSRLKSPSLDPPKGETNPKTLHHTSLKP